MNISVTRAAQIGLAVASVSAFVAFGFGSAASAPTISPGDVAPHTTSADVARAEAFDVCWEDPSTTAEQCAEQFAPAASQSQVQTFIACWEDDSTPVLAKCIEDLDA